ncbi:6-phospho-beta-glucosidase [Roseiflexus sp.]|uniref:6-phospho-beta-glucosidase n=1 Tax=Roseiflexus sp. TaxID=2562120 RepID=UPI00398ABD29
MNIAVIGGGSTYTPELIHGLIARNATLGVQNVWLVDPGEERLNIVGAFVQRMVIQAGAGFQVKLTADRRRALEGADYVITQFRVGGQQARHNDELLGRRHQLVGQETTGIGGFAKALRTIPVMLDIARDMREMAPQAILLNFTNPAGLVTEAVARHGGVPVIGLCNNAINAQRSIARMVDVPPEQVFIEQVGLNHLNWIRRVAINGKDATDTVIAAYVEYLRHDTDPLRFPPRLIQMLRALPSSYLRYFYLTPQIIAKQNSGELTRAAVVMDVERRLLARYADPTLHEMPPELMERGGAYYSTAAAALIESLHTGDNAVHVVNTRNNGAIPNLPDDVVVEMPCRVARDGAIPIPVAPLEPVFHGLTCQVKAYELLTVQAAVEGDEEAAMLALLTNPLGPDAARVESVWEDLKQTNCGLLPTFER